MTSALFQSLLILRQVAESFFHTLNTELIHHEDFQTREEAKRAIFEYIEVFYYHQRKHSTNGYLAPFKFEQNLLSQRKKSVRKSIAISRNDTPLNMSVLSIYLERART